MEAHMITDHDLLHWISEERPASVLTLDRNEYQAAIYVGHPDGRPDGFTLYWTDGVINEWGEWFPGLPTTLVRLGVLERGSATRSFFDQEPQDFRAVAKTLFDAALSRPEWQVSVQCHWCHDEVIEDDGGAWVEPTSTGGDACPDNPHDPPVHQPATY